MSGRSRSRPSAGGVRISDEQITDLIHKLQQLLPEIRNAHSDKVHKHDIWDLLVNFNKILHVLWVRWWFGFAGFVCKGFAGNVQLHSEATPGGGRSERAAVGVVGDVGHGPSGHYKKLAHAVRWSINNVIWDIYIYIYG